MMDCGEMDRNMELPEGSSVLVFYSPPVHTMHFSDGVVDAYLSALMAFRTRHILTRPSFEVA